MMAPTVPGLHLIGLVTSGKREKLFSISKTRAPRWILTWPILGHVPALKSFTLGRGIKSEWAGLGSSTIYTFSSMRVNSPPYIHIFSTPEEKMHFLTMEHKPCMSPGIAFLLQVFHFSTFHSAPVYAGFPLFLKHFKLAPHSGPLDLLSLLRKFLEVA